MTIPAQQLSHATVPPLLVIKWTPPPSIMNNLPLFDTFPTNHVITIREDMNSNIGINENENFLVHSNSNRTGGYLSNFSLEDRRRYYTKSKNERESTFIEYISKQEVDIQHIELRGNGSQNHLRKDSPESMQKYQTKN